MPTPKTIRLTTAQAIVRYLQAQYSERDGQTRRLIPGLFGIFGHGNVSGFSQAVVEYGQKLPFHQPRNEQSMVHVATGFAKANRRLATLACTSSIGPGASNMVTGAYTATVNRLPVLLFPSDYYATRHQGLVLQQLEHPISADVSVNDCFRPVSRFFDRIQRPEQLLTALPEGMRVLTDPVETGAVTIALPQDIQTHAYDFPVRFFFQRIWSVARPQPHPDRIAETVELLKQAKRPAIVAGGGVHYSDAQAELHAFAEAFDLPVGETFAGKGAMTESSPLALGGFGVTGSPAATRILEKADLVICVGTRLTDFTTGSNSAFRHPSVRFISINVASHDAYKLGALPIIADARDALRALHRAAVRAGVKPRPRHRAEAAQSLRKWAVQLKSDTADAAPEQKMSQGQMLRILNEESQTGDTVVSSAGTPVGDLLAMWDCTRGAKCHLEFGCSCMGYDIPASIGVRLAQPKGEVYCVLGDGNYMMHPMELVTSVQDALKITVVLSENHGFQSIHGHQRAHVGHSLGNEFRQRSARTGRLDGDYLELDFVKNAESMGARAWRASTPEALREALREARRETRTCVIVVETEPMRRLPGSGVWWDIPAAAVTNDRVTRRLRAAYDRSRGVQRFYY